MNTIQYSSMYVGDLHGRIHSFELAIEKFEKEKLDKLIFMGDYMDSYDATDTELVYLLEQIINYKKEHPYNVVSLLGNHDIHYIHSPDYRCSGYRSSIQNEVYKLFLDNRDLFQVAWLNGKYMATHAGILSDWYYKYNDRLSYYEEKLNIEKRNNLDILLNNISMTSDAWILYTIPSVRGGYAGSVGGIVWADSTEIKEKGCLHRFNHIVGHNNVKSIEKFLGAEGSLVTFTDCLKYRDEFFVLK